MKCQRIKKVRGRFAQATLHQRDLAYQLWQAGPTDAEAAEKFFDATGIRVSPATLASFASSWPFVREQTLLPDTAKLTAQVLQQIPNLPVSADEIMQVHKTLQAAHALREQDPKLYVQLERLRIAAERVEIDKRKIALLEEQQAKTRKVLTDPELTPEERTARALQIIGHSAA